ncbi:hypothetical protein GCM10012286_22180 [Streptomyces lasiicapitis]|uniref:Uncharacterized protein n=1 Tax=Streptomyces lasiicapitis TaxID=1923961 RepID=A0ABQ2LQC5_9ACTN|nr:hypothetical protein GCM10012286_22180 [Streptomyces lasiicapitis]
MRGLLSQYLCRVAADHPVVYVHGRVKGLSHRHCLRQALAAFTQGRSLVRDAEERGAPYVQHPQRRTAPGGFLEGEVDGGRGMVAAVPTHIHAHDEERLSTDGFVIAHDHHRAGGVRDGR